MRISGRTLNFIVGVLIIGVILISYSQFGLIAPLLAFGAIAGWRWWQTAKLLKKQLAIEGVLRAKEERLVTVMREANDIVLVVNDQKRIVEFNDQALCVYGYSPVELLGLSLPSLRPAELREAQTADFAALSTPTGTFYETVHQRKDGSTFPAEVSGRAVGVTGKTETIIIIRNVTRRKQAELQIQRLNRIHAASNGVSQAIVRTTSADALCREICRVLVEQGKFTMAWVGWLDAATLSIRPSTVFGDKSGYTTNLNIHIDERLEGQGPTGTAFRKDRITASNDFLSDPRTIRWQESARLAGFKSNIAIPIRVGGMAQGILSVYAEERDFFGQPEITLLEEVAGNIAFALDNLERDKRAAKIQNELLEREKILSAIFEQAVDAIALMSVETGRFIEFNESTHRNLGYNREEFACLTLDQIDVDSPLAEIRQNFAQTLQPGGVVMEARHRRRDGQIRDVRICSRGIVINDEPFIVAIWTDITEHKLSETALREREEMLSSIFEQAVDSIVLMDADTGHFVEFNESTHRTLGYTREEFSRMAVVDIEARETPAEIRHAFDQSLLPGGIVLDVCHRHRNGELHEVRVSARGIKLKDKDYVFAIWTDITESKQAEAALRQSEARFRLLFKLAPVPLGIYTSQDLVSYLNDEFIRVFGYSQQDIPTLEQWWQRAYPDEIYRRGVMEKWHTSLSLAEELHVHVPPSELQVVCKDGTVRTVEISGTNLGNDVLAAFFDLTERRRAETQLKLQSAAMNAAANAIVITDFDGKIEWVNTAFSSNTGYTLAEAAGQNPRLLKSGMHSLEFYENLWATIKNGRVWHGELTNRRKDGSLYEEDMTITPMKDSTGKITHFIAIKQDVTQKKVAERQLYQAQRLESIGLLAGGIAHDLNNVLAPVLMSTELLRSMELPADALSILDTVETSARRGADIVQQVLTFARGKPEHKGPVQFRHLIKDIVKLAKETFPRDIGVSSHLPGDLWPVNGDGTQLHQILLNLSLNARDAMPAGGTLTFHCCNAHLDEIIVKDCPHLEPGDYVKLEVSDTGTGISPELVDKIFEPFFTTKELGKGTGLGLSTVMGIVRGHGGCVTVESTLGQGTKFTVLLPALPATDTGEGGDNRPALPKGHQELILIVDDEPGILTVTQAFLQRQDFRTITAVNGAEALTAFIRQPTEIALVITDIMMPVMDGVALVSELRRIKPEIKCIACSGLLEEKDAVRLEQLKAHGVKHFLTKPFGAGLLLDTVGKILRGEV